MNPTATNNPTTSNTATTKSQTQEENGNIADISNAAKSMPIAPPAININPTQPVTMDDYLNTKLTLEEKRKLRYDLLSLPPEKLGEIMYVLQKSQPQNIVQIGDEIEIDLKKLNTKTLRHLQRYVESVFVKVRFNSMQPVMMPQKMIPIQPMQPIQPLQQRMFVPHQPMQPMPQFMPPNQTLQQQGPKLQLSDLMPAAMDTRKRSYEVMNGENGFVIGGYRPQRKKRSAFTTKQKEQMIQFWQTVNWQAIPSDHELEEVGRKIGVGVAQLKIFRQNNRKKYADSESAPSSPVKVSAINNDNSNESQNEIQPQTEQEQDTVAEDTADAEQKQE